MHQKRQFIVLAIAITLVLAVAACTKADHSESTNQTGAELRAQRQAAFLPPYYTDLSGVQIPKSLPPERFRVAKTRQSYRVARAIPEALMQLPCYCWCERIDHKSLLDCFVDEHAEFCGICQDSAFWAEKRLKEQASVATIRQEIVERYSREYGTR